MSGVQFCIHFERCLQLIKSVELPTVARKLHRKSNFLAGEADLSDNKEFVILGLGINTGLCSSIHNFH